MMGYVTSFKPEITFLNFGGEWQERLGKISSMFRFLSELVEEKLAYFMHSAKRVQKNQIHSNARRRKLPY